MQEDDGSEIPRIERGLFEQLQGFTEVHLVYLSPQFSYEGNEILALLMRSRPEGVRPPRRWELRFLSWEAAERLRDQLNEMLE